MKVTYNWLKEYVEIDLQPAELVDTLTMLGLEVDSFYPLPRNFDGVVIGKIEKVRAHENADKLKICDVNLGSKSLSIVCGAPNVETGQKVPVAVVGTRLPNGTLIRKAKIRGVESEGMICSEAELGLSSRADGIMVLDMRASEGDELGNLLGPDDFVYDIDVTPNRPDCFGALGIAREIAAQSNKQLKKPKVKIKETGKNISDLFSVNILDSGKCPRFTARFIGDVEIKPSPWWLIARLESIGVRSINNIVDVTNYVMMETGQPLHAYDYHLLNGQQINVKTAKKGGTFTTLDEKKHELNSDSLMICDGQLAVGIGGIMGGANSEVSNKTKDILLEAANFDPVNIRRTSKALGITTEASKRFERGADPNGPLYALDRAAQLIAELSGGEVARGVIDVYPKKITPKEVILRPERVELLLGVKISTKEINEILKRLNFEVSGSGKLTVEIPTNRPDITREADLIEEVARLYGYENIPADSQTVIEQLVPRNQHESFLKKTKEILLGTGFSEAVTYNLIHPKYAEFFVPGKDAICPVNPLSEDLSTLRPSLVPSLLSILRRNLNRNSRNLKLFEIGTIFQRAKGKIIEKTKLAAVLTGHFLQPTWKLQTGSVDIYDLKGYVGQLLQRNNITNLSYRVYTNQYLRNEGLSIDLNKKTAGCLGELKQDLLESFEIEQPVFFFEIDLASLQEQIEWNPVFKAIPKFPAVKRDLAIVVAENIKAGDVMEDIRANGGPHLQEVDLFDIFRGNQVGEALKSLAVSLTFYSLNKTLTEQEIDLQVEHIFNKLSQKYSARLRDKIQEELS